MRPCHMCCLCRHLESARGRAAADRVFSAVVVMVVVAHYDATHYSRETTVLLVRFSLSKLAGGFAQLYQGSTPVNVIGISSLSHVAHRSN